MAGMGLRRAAEGLHRTVHKVKSAAPMTVRVDKPGTEISAGKINLPAVLIARRYRSGSDGGNRSVLYGDKAVLLLLPVADDGRMMQYLH